jgi:hypothetical protein
VLELPWQHVQTQQNRAVSKHVYVDVGRHHSGELYIQLRQAIVTRLPWYRCFHPSSIITAPGQVVDSEPDNPPSVLCGGSLVGEILPPKTGAHQRPGRRPLPFPRSGAIMKGSLASGYKSPWYDKITFHDPSFEQWSDQYP